MSRTNHVKGSILDHIFIRCDLTLDDLAGVEDAVRVEQLLQSSVQRQAHRAELGLQEGPLQQAYAVLDVPRGPVVSEECGTSMAEGVRRLLDADVAVALTGVGGPDEQDGQPPGTVYVAVSGAEGGSCRHHRFEGDPKTVLTAATLEALRSLDQHLDQVATST